MLFGGKMAKKLLKILAVLLLAGGIIGGCSVAFTHYNPAPEGGPKYDRQYMGFYPIVAPPEQDLIINQWKVVFSVTRNIDDKASWRTVYFPIILGGENPTMDVRSIFNLKSNDEIEIVGRKGDVGMPTTIFFVISTRPKPKHT